MSKNQGDFLFVYGDLMKGMPRHSLLKGATLEGEARTGSEWHLLSLPGEVPVMMRGGTTSIVGELYKGVDWDGLDSAIEPWLDRFCISVVMVDHKGPFLRWADTYALSASDHALSKGANQVKSGDWKRWLSVRSIPNGGISTGMHLKGPNERPFSVFMSDSQRVMIS